MKCSILTTPLILFAFWATPSAAQAADPVVSGTTSTVNGDDYKPLDGVEVTVMRKSGVASDTSRGGGNFEVKFTAGTPVYVVFFGPDNHLPELQSLSAEADTKHVVHIALVTADEARKEGINPYQQVKTMIEFLKSRGVAETDEVVKHLKRIMQKFG